MGFRFHAIQIDVLYVLNNFVEVPDICPRLYGNLGSKYKHTPIHHEISGQVRLIDTNPLWCPNQLVSQISIQDIPHISCICNYV